MPTVAQFKEYGMADLSELTAEAIEALESDDIKILVLTKDSSVTGYKVEVTAIPKPTLVMQETDMTLPAPIKSFTLTATVQNSSVLKVIVSGDSGTTWKAFDSVTAAWKAINTQDVNNVKTDGMTVATLNAVTEEKWKELLTNKKARFAYYFDLNAIGDTLSIDKLAYETIPIVKETPTLQEIKTTFDDLTLEGRLKDLERLNAINLAKLNFKANAILKSRRYEMHDMIIDTCDTEEMNITSASSASTLRQEGIANDEVIDITTGKIYSFSLSQYERLSKVEVIEDVIEVV